MQALASSLVSSSPLALLALRVEGCPVRVSPCFACWYANPCGLCVLRARSGCPSGPRCVPVVCVCARAFARGTWFSAWAPFLYYTVQDHGIVRG